MTPLSRALGLAGLLAVWMGWAASPSAAEPAAPLSVNWTNHMLTVSGGRLKAPIPIWYLEAYCRPGSTDRAWDETVIGHATELISRSADGRELRLRDTLGDGVVVTHHIRAGQDEVRFSLEARNPGSEKSLAHWAQPCMRVDQFAGARRDDFHAVVPEYARKCFIFLDGTLRRLPTEPWALEARYTPGQVWAAPGVDRDDVNPRPLSALTPSNGIIGCFSADGETLVAMAWDSWQELFLGIIGCIHADFRLGGLAPGEMKRVEGRLYVMANDVPALLRRVERDLGAR
jgi:hypothetical protein